MAALSEDQTQVPRILVVRGGALGDFVLTLPAIALLREAFPHCRLELMGYQHIIELANRRGYADAIRSIDYGPMAGFFAARGNLDEELAAYFAGFQQVVSFLFDPDGVWRANLQRAGVKNLIEVSPKIHDGLHASYQLAQPLQRLALYLDNPAARMYPSDEDCAQALHFLNIHGVQPTEKLLVVHPSSGGAAKNLSPEFWSKALTSVCKNYPHVRRIVVGGEADYEVLDCLQQNTSEGIILARDLTLPTLAALLQKASVYCGHDTGVSHMAAAVGAPCWLAFGPTDPEVWAPPHEHVQVFREPNRALKDLAFSELQGQLEAFFEPLLGSASL